MNKNNIKGKITMGDNMGTKSRTIQYMGDGRRIERITLVSLQRMLIHRPINPTSPANGRWTIGNQHSCHLRALPHDPARQGISTSNLGLSTTLTPILQLSPIASYRLKYSKKL